MLSLKLIREQTDLVREGLAKKHETAPIDEIIALDEKRRSLLSEVETLRAQRNAVSQQIAKMKVKPPELVAQMRQVGDRIKELDSQVAEVEPRLNELLLYVPNLPDESVPVGKDESENVVVKHWGKQRQFDFEPRPHWEIGERLGVIDFARGVKISGTRFYVLKGLLARMERAIIDFMLDLHTREHGYTEVATPYLVKRESMTGTGQLPKFEEDAYKISDEELFLIPTAEVPVTNLYRDEILEPGTLPIYHVAYSACFRKEAGAAGRDTRGMVRVHQFDKVEMVKFVEPSSSFEELEKLLDNAEEVLRRLEIPYRVSLMCTGDLGFTAAKKYDPEAWCPGQNRYVEISSCSNFTDFQARRANIRFRAAPGEKPEFVHTLNGSGLAVGRTMVAVLENYQQADGSVVVPEALVPFMGGIDRIEPAS
ncbi:MAG: serine--tRNA ligase [Chloroflexi bacterium]|nr:serine--tRNA ligase [Chloroflexota bacterium]